MLDLFENGNFRRRRRRRNMKIGLRDSADTPFHPLESNQALPATRRREPDLPLCPLNPDRQRPVPQQSHLVENPGQGKPESEIKFSIDYILSTPDPPLPGFRSPHGPVHIGPAGPSIHVLEPQHLNLHFWTLWEKEKENGLSDIRSLNSVNTGKQGHANRKLQSVHEDLTKEGQYHKAKKRILFWSVYI